MGGLPPPKWRRLWHTSLSSLGQFPDAHDHVFALSLDILRSQESLQEVHHDVPDRPVLVQPCAFDPHLRGGDHEDRSVQLTGDSLQRPDDLSLHIQVVLGAVMDSSFWEGRFFEGDEEGRLKRSAITERSPVCYRLDSRVASAKSAARA